MKRNHIVLSLSFVLGLTLQSCSKKEKPINSFTSDQDTLKIQLTKVKGGGLFSLGFGVLNFDKYKNNIPTKIIKPKDIDSIQRYPLEVDLIDKKNTTYIELLKGVKNGRPVFIVDQNNNKDLTDDPVREYKQMDFKNVEMIPVTYTILDGLNKVQDSSWLRMGKNYSSFLIGKNEHLRANFSFEGKKYSIQAADPTFQGLNYLTFFSKIVLNSTPEMTKDSISERDILQKGELLNLNGTFYRFDSIANSGKFLALVKDQPINKKTGTQIGMNAPDFSVLSTEGERLNKDQLKDKITIIANSCGCGGDKESTQAVADVIDEFGDKLNVLQVDSAIKEKLNTYQIDIEVKENKAFYDTYRKLYCSRLVYVIGTDGTIVDKFSIFDWRDTLPSIVN